MEMYELAYMLHDGQSSSGYYRGDELLPVTNLLPDQYTSGHLFTSDQWESIVMLRPTTITSSNQQLAIGTP